KRQTEGVIKGVGEAARGKAVELHILKASTDGEIDAALGTVMQLHPDALLVGPDPFFFSRRELLVALASRYALPAIYEWREFVTAGGLISYAASLTRIFRQFCIYTGTRFKRATPDP